MYKDPGKYTKGAGASLDKNWDFLGQIPQVWLDKMLGFSS